MEYLIAGTIYIASVLLTRLILMRAFTRPQTSVGDFIICVAPVFNTFFAAGFILVLLVANMKSPIKKVADWFFKNND